MRKYYLVALLFLAFACKETPKLENTSSLLQDFRFNSGDRTIISAHRGGKGIAAYPENCLETIQYIHQSIPAIYEIDIAQTKDEVLVLMHDDNLERTTTGQGKINQYTFKELQNYNLVDDFGNPTEFHIPKFEDVLNWAKRNRAVLTIDIKKSVDVKDVVDLVHATNSEDISIIITYDLKQAKRAHKLAPGLLLSVSARNQQELDWLLNSNIPTENMLAFTGTRHSNPELYETIHSYGIKCILGTLGNLDNQAKARGNHLYKDWVSRGIDVVATDRPFAVAESLQLNK